MKLVLENVEKSYEENQVLKKASFTFETDKIYGLLGRNGSGKTTLFNCINGDVKFDNGKIMLFDEGYYKEEIDYSKVGYVFSEPVLPEFLN